MGGSMSSVVISGDTSGAITVAAPSVAGTNTITLPAATGTVALTSAPTFTGQATIPTINLTGGQITFPATQNSSSDANTLDDYEEGTFTPTVSTGVTSPTYSNQIGYYTKIGNIVYCHIFITVNGTLNGSNFQISGLPFSVYTDADGGYWSYCDKFNNLGYFPAIYVFQNSTNIFLYNRSGGSLAGTNLDSVPVNMRFSTVYRVA